ncbi:MAG: hypothetical protein C9356_08960 [Oleiphilus sp.]|nr:MAG: hypothetical protein C9356_08960 [Oleiphilus sp.]
MPIVREVNKRFRFNKLGHRLSFYFISICIVFTLITVSSLLMRQYIADRATVFTEGEKTIKAVEQQLARSLWNVDQDSTRILLEGMYRMPSIHSLRIVESLGNSYEYGAVDDEPDLTTNLEFNGQGLGRLEVDVNEKLITDNVIDQMKVIIISTTLMIGMIGFVFSIIVRRAVTKHLSAIRDANYDPSGLNAKTFVPIELDRPDYDDELSDLVEALNEGRRQTVEFALARESYENQLEYQANFDVLTDLPNRRHIDRHLKEDMRNYDHSDHRSKLAMFFIDLDGFKEVNDSLGHSAGDRILQESSGRLKALFEKYEGYVARFGGDEFIATFQCISRSKAEEVAEEIINVFKESFSLNDSQLQLGCSIGVVMYPEDGKSTEELIRKADTAMYKAKEAGRNTYEFFDQTMMHDILLNNTIKTKLQSAISEQKLEIYYQPLINLKNMSLSGFEALIRWEDDDLGKVRPDLFIPIAEKTGLIFDIDTWVFENSIEQVRQWRQDYKQDFIISVNFSSTNFHHRSLSSWIKEHKIFLQRLDWVELEVTERLVLDDDPTVTKRIDQLLQAGLRFSIDDFGTGYSSLGYIKKFSHILSKVKMDRVFVNEIINSNSDRALVKSIVTLAESLSIEVLAEGIETRKQEEVLVNLGCDYAQGFLYAKPMPAAEVEEFIKTWNQTPHIVSTSDKTV